jgi:hypothetical protein
MSRQSSWVLLANLLFLACRDTNGPPAFSGEDLGTLGTTTTLEFARLSTNSRGDWIVASSVPLCGSCPQPHAVLWQNGTVTDLAFNASDLNDQGDVVGSGRIGDPGGWVSVCCSLERWHDIVSPDIGRTLGRGQWDQ